MKLVSSTVISAAALLVALSFTPVQAEPQQGGMSNGGPPAAGNNAGGDDRGGAIGSPADRPDQAGAAAGNSDQMDPGEGKGKSAEGAMPSEGQSGKGVKDGNDPGMKTGEELSRNRRQGQKQISRRHAIGRALKMSRPGISQKVKAATRQKVSRAQRKMPLASPKLERRPKAKVIGKIDPARACGLSPTTFRKSGPISASIGHPRSASIAIRSLSRSALAFPQPSFCMSCHRM